MKSRVFDVRLLYVGLSSRLRNNYQSKMRRNVRWLVAIGALIVTEDIKLLSMSGYMVTAG